jgi:hypothetical protein
MMMLLYPEIDPKLNNADLTGPLTVQQDPGFSSLLVRNFGSESGWIQTAVISFNGRTGGKL